MPAACRIFDISLFWHFEEISKIDVLLTDASQRAGLRPFVRLDSLPYNVLSYDIQP